MEKTVLDNREAVKKLLRFDKKSKEIFYYLQIIQRKKENPDLNVPEIKRWRLFISDPKSLEKSDKYIEFLCKSMNARAYLSVLPRSLKKYSTEVIKSYLLRIEENNYDQCFRIGDKIALSDKIVQWKGVLDKSRLLLDFDEPQENKDGVKLNLEEKGFVIESILPTKNGFHIIVENCNPEFLLKGTKGTGGTGDIECDGLKFTVIRQCNTVYYAAWEEGA